MEHSGPDVVKMTQQREDAASLLVIPHFDLIIVSARDKKRLLFVEIHSSHGSIVLVKLVKKRAHPKVVIQFLFFILYKTINALSPVVPELEDSIMERG